MHFPIFWRAFIYITATTKWSQHVWNLNFDHQNGMKEWNIAVRTENHMNYTKSQSTNTVINLVKHMRRQVYVMVDCR